MVDRWPFSEHISYLIERHYQTHRELHDDENDSADHMMKALAAMSLAGLPGNGQCHER
jgi:phage shock protein A